MSKGQGSGPPCRFDRNGPDRAVAVLEWAERAGGVKDAAEVPVAHGESHNPKRAWNADALDAIALVVRVQFTNGRRGG